MEEEWKKCFEEYEISNLGNCRLKGKPKSGSIMNTGYRYFQIKRGGKRTNFLFHTLVAQCFIGERPHKFVIDHINRDRLDNRVENLRYITQKENTHNSSKYRTDILETDRVIRRRIISKESSRRTGKVKGDVKREKGTGQLYQRNVNGSWRGIIIINKIKYEKSFKNKEDAELFLKNTFLQHNQSSTPQNLVGPVTF